MGIGCSFEVWIAEYTEVWILGSETWSFGDGSSGGSVEKVEV